MLLTVAVGAGGAWLYDRLSPPSATVGLSPTAGEAPAPPLPSLSSTRASVAVLPFINQSGDASQDYFSDGLTEDVIAALGRFPSLTVMSRSAVFPYKGRNIPPAEIGRELGVRYLVEGSVRRDGERIRINAQLSDAAKGELLWSKQYDGDLRDVFAVQDTITRSVGGALAVNLTRVEQQRALAKPTDDLDAYDLVLRGRERLWIDTRASNREARRLFERAIEMDPRYATAYAWLGRAYIEIAEAGWTEDPGEAVDRAFELARKALSLNPDDVEGLSVMGSAHTIRGEYDLALAASDRLLVINPSDADGMFGRLTVLLWLGRIDEAVATGEEAFRLNPNPRLGSVFSLRARLLRSETTRRCGSRPRTRRCPLPRQLLPLRGVGRRLCPTEPPAGGGRGAGLASPRQSVFRRRYRGFALSEPGASSLPARRACQGGLAVTISWT